jgi:hypothetical protein
MHRRNRNEEFSAGEYRQRARSDRGSSDRGGSDGARSGHGGPDHGASDDGRSHRGAHCLADLTDRYCYARNGGRRDSVDPGDDAGK